MESLTLPYPHHQIGEARSDLASFCKMRGLRSQDTFYVFSLSIQKYLKIKQQTLKLKEINPPNLSPKLNCNHSDKWVS